MQDTRPRYFHLCEILGGVGTGEDVALCITIDSFELLDLYILFRRRLDLHILVSQLYSLKEFFG